MTTDMLSALQPAKGAVRKRKRVGRGPGSGHGRTATRGNNGEKARSGHRFKLYFEGGQMPLLRRVPKFGFKSLSRVEYQVVNLDDLEKLAAMAAASEITPEELFKGGLISKKGLPVKVLGQGEIKAKLKVSAHKFSKSAAEKIQAAGGSITVLS